MLNWQMEFNFEHSCSFLVEHWYVDVHFLVFFVWIMYRMILYAITLANYDQEDAESLKNLILTKDGIESLALYTKSVAR